MLVLLQMDLNLTIKIEHADWWKIGLQNNWLSEAQVRNKKQVQHDMN